MKGADWDSAVLMQKRFSPVAVVVIWEGDVL
jgi:hypothetical protein